MSKKIELEEEKRIAGWIDAYEEISSLTGVKVEDLRGKSYVLVTNPDSDYYGRVGIFKEQYAMENKISVKFNGLRKLVEFGYPGKEGNEVIWSSNAPALMDSRSRLS